MTEKKPWVAPRLIHHGHIKDLTKGGSGPGNEGGGFAADGFDGATSDGGDTPVGHLDKSKP